MEADKTTHQFKPNSRFEDAVALYNFDIELRDLMFKAVQRLEIALRTKIIQEFSLAHRNRFGSLIQAFLTMSTSLLRI